MKSAKLEKHIDALRAGDLRAFDALYEQTNRTVYFAALYIVRDKMYAEDILQETYVRALRSLDSYTPGTNFTAWLTRIAKNLALNHVKSAKRTIPTDFQEDSYKYGTQETHLPYIFDVAAKVLSEEEFYSMIGQNLCQACLLEYPPSKAENTGVYHGENSISNSASRP